MKRAYKDPLHPQKHHYKLFVNPWLDGVSEHRLEAWPARSLKPSQLERSHDDLEQPGAELSLKDSTTRAQDGFLVLTENLLIHETAITWKSQAPHHVGTVINLASKAILHGVGPIMCPLHAITSLNAVPDSSIIRIDADSRLKWYVSIGCNSGLTPVPKLRGSVQRRDEVLARLQTAVA
jgi:hypothetical protein